MIVDLNKDDTVYYESAGRLGRSLKDLKDLIDIIEQLVNKGVRVVIVKEGIDTDRVVHTNYC
ncbi:DNA invertase Pin-like site-specific DNA recombinase [Clostridium beijerinckii]|nr:DNA invertase Pin-like site-specific DNA recombinase [Clostridium beijerinckii]NRT27579.1 DNA invertase Pin-like site-specific DNA recombinase [Clostridium beijerinckii]NRU01213.1 DNA invertase Pin-like site-specific DNA recombinase [Clostridium beijerinckii]NRV23266.1 DNA invertase Pin-like site-specific DNA recombinase [Clostridium beijerinckii]NRV94948.1 DNA invertase Pin-like site-specific DNA recombinase [Clostridium beijerinckii]